MSFALTAESSGPPSASSHLTWKVPSPLALRTVPGYLARARSRRPAPERMCSRGPQLRERSAVSACSALQAL
eukprot:15451504-Alexandrium_andersonii.AAC.1